MGLKFTLRAIFYFLSPFLLHAQNEKSGGSTSADTGPIRSQRYEKLGWSDGGKVPVDGFIGFKVSNYWGLLSQKGGAVTDAKYAILYPSQIKGHFIAARKGKLSNKLFFGVLDTKGRAALGFQYDEIIAAGEQYIIKIDSISRVFYGVVSQNEKTLIPAFYELIDFTSAGNFVAKRNSKWYFFSEDGEITGHINADSLVHLKKNYFTFYLNGKAGVAMADGTIVVPVKYKAITLNNNILMGKPFATWKALDLTLEPKFMLEFDDLEPLNSNLKIIHVSGAKGVVNEMGEFLLNPEYEEIVELDDTFFKVKKNNKWGVLNMVGTQILPMRYEQIELSSGYFIAKHKAGESPSWAVYDKKGKSIIKEFFDTIKVASGNLIFVMAEKGWRAINREGEQVSNLQFKEVQQFNNGFSIVHYLDQFGIVNQNIEFVCQPTYDSISYLGNNLYQAKKGYYSELIDINGKKYYSTLGNFFPVSAGIIEVDEDDKKGFLSSEGKVILTSEWEKLDYYNDNTLAVYSKKRGAGLYDLSGKWIIEPDTNYQKIFNRGEPFFRAVIDGRYGFIDEQSRLRIANRYDYAMDFSENIAAVKINGRWGFIDTREQLVIQPQYDTIYVFQWGLAVAKTGQKYGVIDKNNTVRLAFEYDDIHRIDDYGFKLYDNGKVGFASHNLAYKIPPRYDELYILPNGFLKVKRKGKYGIVDKEGLPLLPIVYNDLFYDKFTDSVYLEEERDWVTLSPLH